jgi:3',5'-cyclic AMP phosphodiesterase CpdA
MLIAQISDTHISLPGAEVEARFATAAHLAQAVDCLNSLPTPPDLAILTGDCVEGGTEAEYERFREIVRPLAMPLYVVPGNHDNRELMLRLFGPQGEHPLAGYVQYAVEAGPVRLLALDTHWPGEPGGRLAPEQLAWLEARLAEAPDRPAIIFQHHPPFATGNAALDGMGLLDAEALGAVVARYPNVARILAGHIHCPMQRVVGGALALTCPATAQQAYLDAGQPERLSVVLEPPACLVHAWVDGAGVVTHTRYIGDYGPLMEP